MKMCATDNCASNATGKSKYCDLHKKEARARFKMMLSEQSSEKLKRETAFYEALHDAHDAGAKAGQEARPNPMIVKGYEDQPVMDGVCGFAYITVKPGNCRLANYMKKNGFGNYWSYDKAVVVSISYFNQSMERKERYAEAYSKLLAERVATIDPRARVSHYSRMD